MYRMTKRIKKIIRWFKISRELITNNEYIELGREIQDIENKIAAINSQDKYWKYHEKATLFFSDDKIDGYTKRIDIPILIAKELILNALEKHLKELTHKYDNFIQ